MYRLGILHHTRGKAPHLEMDEAALCLASQNFEAAALTPGNVPD